MVVWCYRRSKNTLEGLRIVLSSYSTSPTTSRYSTYLCPPIQHILRPSRLYSSLPYSSSSRSPQYSSGNSEHDPLKPRYPTDDLGLPISPLPLCVPSPKPGNLTSGDLERLHRLSALNPPPADSPEEKELLKGLNELVGLMDLVKSVELPKENIGGLLGEGVREVVFDASTDPVETPPWAPDARAGSMEKGEDGGREVEKKGKELLNWATRRKGDYYAYRSPPRPKSS